MADTDRTRGGLLQTLALLGALFLVLMGAGAAVNPPPALRAQGVAGFDARAAVARLARILGDETPHPVDSAAEDVTRARLLAELEALGFKPEIHEAFACRPQPRGPLIDCGHVRNIVFSMGPESGPAVLASAHYDSVPAAPGASDDGIGIGVWLEVARELAHTRLHRRVIFLFSDGEEQALLGAYQFAHHDPLMEDVEALVELESRGTRGPAVFFESNQPNADAIRAYAGVARPVANSITADIYHLLPNSTDVTVLTRPGLDVINIAVLDGVENYHTPRDNLAALDLRSVQHMGDQALSVLTAFASAPDAGATETLVYTDIASRFFIAAPGWLAHVVLALAALVAFAALWRSGPNGRWRSFALPLVALVIPALLALAFGLLLDFVIRPGETYWWAHRELTRVWCVALGLSGAPLAMLLLGAKTSPAQAEAAGLFWFAGLGALIALAMPGISILFVVPAAIYALGVVAALAWKAAQPIGALIAGIVALCIWAPMLSLNELALGFQFPFANALLFALVSLPWLGSMAHLQGSASWRWPSIALGCVALIGLVAAAIAPAATLARPQYLNLSYFYNGSTGEGRVLAGSAQRALPRELKAAMAFEPELIFPGDRIPYWSARVAGEPKPGPELQDIRFEIEGGQRTLHARLAMHGAYRAIIRIPRAVAPLSASINGASADFADVGHGEPTNQYMNLACQGRSCEGASVAIALPAASEPGEWLIVGQFLGAAGPALPAIGLRPATRTQIQLGDGAVTLTKLRV